MKKLYLSPVLFFTAQLSFLLLPISAHYAAGTSCRSYENFISEPFTESAVPSQENRHRVWLNLTNSEGLFKQILIGYIAGATNGWDMNYDAVTVDANRYADFYSVNEGKKLVIQGRALPLETNDAIPLGYRSAIKGNLTISIDHADGDLATQDIYLLDKQTGRTYNLRNGGHTFSTETGTFNSRFELRYAADKKLGTKESSTSSRLLTVASKNKVISLGSSDSLLEEVSVFDINGKLLYSNQSIGRSDLEISTIQSSVQILLVKTKLGNGNTITKKIIF